VWPLGKQAILTPAKDAQSQSNKQSTPASLFPGVSYGMRNRLASEIDDATMKEAGRDTTTTKMRKLK
jgi:hypothetical protein